MRIMLSPALRMKETEDFFVPKQKPALLEKTRLLMDFLRGCSLGELKKILNCNERIAEENYRRYQKMRPEMGNLPAMFAFEGIQYQYMRPQVFSREDYAYLEEHLRILSGLYGVLRPFDGIFAYRLEMRTKCTVEKGNLYSFWGEEIYNSLVGEEKVILNLASKEYSRAVFPYLSPSVRLVTCRFLEEIEGRGKEKTVYVKMARGAMVRFMAENKITEVEDVKNFQEFGYHYDQARSTEEIFVFIR